MTETKRREAEREAIRDVENGFYPVQNPYNHVREAAQFFHYLTFGFNYQAKKNYDNSQKRLDNTQGN